jgi:hypothetical protein
VAPLVFPRVFFRTGRDGALVASVSDSQGDGAAVSDVLATEAVLGDVRRLVAETPYQLSFNRFHIAPKHDLSNFA